MQKELHIWMGKEHPSNLAISLEETEMLLNRGEQRVDTPQPNACSTTWLSKGYKIFVHMLDGEIVEIKLGHIGNNPKEIRPEHNLEKMLLAGCFGKSTI